jgi:hypothetical protein
MTWSCNIGSYKEVAWLKKDVPRLGMPSSTKVWIFTQLEFEPMVFSK